MNRDNIVSLLEEAQRNADERQTNEPAARRMEELRAISNVAQAIENLIAQCGSAPFFAELQLSAQNELLRARRELQRKVHAPVRGDRG